MGRGDNQEIKFSDGTLRMRFVWRHTRVSFDMYDRDRFGTTDGEGVPVMVLHVGYIVGWSSIRTSCKSFAENVWNDVVRC